MKIASFTSGGKGGTGKTTISSLLTIGLAISGYRVLIVDASWEGGASRLLLGNFPPPYLRDVLTGNNGVEESILKCKIELPKIGEIHFYIIPNLGLLPRIDLSHFVQRIKRFEKYFDFVIFDLPAYQDKWFESFLMYSDYIVKVAEPNLMSFSALASIPDYDNPVVYVLNQPRFYSKNHVKQFVEDVTEKFSPHVYVFPYEPVIPMLSPANAGVVLSSLSKEFQDSLFRLGSFLVKPKVKGD